MVGTVHCIWPKYSYRNLMGSLSPSCTLMGPLPWLKANYPIHPQTITFSCGQSVDGGSSANSACAGIGFSNSHAAFGTTCCFFLVGFCFYQSQCQGFTPEMGTWFISVFIYLCRKSTLFPLLINPGHCQGHHWCHC